MFGSIAAFCTIEWWLANLAQTAHGSWNERWKCLSLDSNWRLINLKTNVDKITVQGLKLCLVKHQCYMVRNCTCRRSRHPFFLLLHVFNWSLHQICLTYATKENDRMSQYFSRSKGYIPFMQSSCTLLKISIIFKIVESRYSSMSSMIWQICRLLYYFTLRSFHLTLLVTGYFGLWRNYSFNLRKLKKVPIRICECCCLVWRYTSRRKW